jgi:chemosensory pili system protein ChpA (sensor histidine kinase/response regulator)
VPEAAEPEPEIEAAVEAAPEPEEEGPIVIGDVSMSPVLFNIASEEALEHVHALRACFDVIQASAKPVVSYDFMRAAHTLAGVNRTMGFLPVAELAYTLEMWLEPRIDKAGAIGTPQLVLLDDVITRLDELCNGVRERKAPAAQTELIERLQADKVLGGSDIPQEPEEQPNETIAAIAAPSEANAQIAAAEPAPEAVPEEAEEETPAPQTELHERTVHDEVDEQLLPIFLEEAHELYPQIGSTLRAWRDAPEDAQQGRNLQRSLHTLKGSARMAGAMRLGELTHRVEDRVSKAISQNVLDENLWNEMDNYLDRIAHAIEQLTQPAADEAPAQAAEVPAALAAPAAPVAALEVGAERAMQSALLRVRSDIVDRLVNEAGEVSVTRSRAEAELREFRTSVLELTDSVSRLRKQLREIEIQAESQMQANVAVSTDVAGQFDPLEFDRFTRFQELTRFMTESVHDVQTVQQTLLKNLDETAAALNAQAHINRDLQQGLMSIRMVPFASISERLYRIVRQTGKELGKRANLELSGTEIELDRSVLEKMTAPFEHLLRNAIAHGLEMPEQRSQSGKPPIGEVRFSLRQESNEVVFELADDGAGLDIGRIRQKALDSGLITPDEEISDEQLMQLIFTAGLSTAGEVTEIAGRGVGLDVVRSEVSALGGRVDVSSEPGKGVRFTIHLPLTLAVTRTLMVRAAHAVYALPGTMVEHVQQVKPAELSALYAQQYVDWQGKRYPLFYLPRVLGDDQAEVVSLPHNPILLLRSGEQRIALHVDALLGNQEVVVKNIGPQLARLPGIAGATVSSSGAVILIINPVAFTQRIAVTRKIAKKVETEAVHTKPLIMVVDDSLTVRKITTRLLERSGYLTVTAKDGVDALEQLMEISPDVMLLDIEMPRMDGFELAKRLRQDSKTKALPIIMITSRTADKHRNYAMELGVNEYLGKPFQEEELLGHVSRYTS